MRLAADKLRMADLESVFAAKVRTEFVVGNTSALGLLRSGVLVPRRCGFAVFRTGLLFRLIGLIFRILRGLFLLGLLFRLFFGRILLLAGFLSMDWRRYSEKQQQTGCSHHLGDFHERLLLFIRRRTGFFAWPTQITPKN